VNGAIRHDLHPPAADLRREVLAGLSGQQKQLSPKFFYDAHGSALFDAITALPEYYPTRTEIAILRGCRAELAQLLGPGTVVIEPGGGNGAKARLLLDSLAPRAYAPIDIARNPLFEAADGLAADYPAIDVHAICADFSRSLQLPALPTGERRVAFFPGSSIGNFDREHAVALLQRLAELVGPGGALLIGVDLQKDAARLESAYDDVQGVTAAFNLNMLARLNRELGADFRLERFAHRAHYDEEAGRIEMHLVSRAAQQARIDDKTFAFAEGETIHTENSYKYTPEGFAALAAAAGFRPLREWHDPDDLFAVFLFEC